MKDSLFMKGAYFPKGAYFHDDSMMYEHSITRITQNDDSMVFLLMVFVSIYLSI